MSSIVSKASQPLGFLRRNFKFTPLKIPKLAYCSMVNSKALYAASVLVRGKKQTRHEVSSESEGQSSSHSPSREKRRHKKLKYEKHFNVKWKVCFKKLQQASKITIMISHAIRIPWKAEG